MNPNAGGGVRGCGASPNEYSCAHEAQINFGDLTPYLTYGISGQFPLRSQTSSVNKDDFLWFQQYVLPLINNCFYFLQIVTHPAESLGQSDNSLRFIGGKVGLLNLLFTKLLYLSKVNF